MSGAGLPPVLYEVPTGLPLAELLREHADVADSGLNVLFGGFFGSILPAVPGLRLDHAGLLGRGGSLGCGSVHLLDRSACVVATTADVVGFYARHNAGQCGMCMASTTAIAASLAALARPARGLGYEARLPRWANQLRGRGACAVPDAVAVLLRSLLRYHPDVVSRHIREGCALCLAAQDGSSGGNRWDHLRVDLPDSEPSVVGTAGELTLAGQR